MTAQKPSDPSNENAHVGPFAFGLARLRGLEGF
jgi:hypothetical protein